MTVVLTSIAGDGILVVATAPFPTLEHASWTSQWLTGDMVQVLPGDPSACTPPCVYYIGVTGGLVPVEYTIVATDGQGAEPLVLTLGQPQVRKWAHGTIKGFAVDELDVPLMVGGPLPTA